MAVVGLVDLAALRRIRRIRFRDFALALVALAGVLLLGVLQGELVAVVVVSILTLIHGTNHPPIEVLGRKPGTGHWRDVRRHPDGQTFAGLLALRPRRQPDLGRRRTSSSSRPSCRILASTPYSAAWSGSQPWMAVLDRSGSGTTSTSSSSRSAASTSSLAQP